jgi:hypothetical protein
MIKLRTRIQTLTITPTELPLTYPSFTFPPAGALVDRDPDVEIEYKLNVHRVENQMEEFTRQHGTWEIGAVFPLEFVRMIAKIAHSYAVAELKVDGFSPYLLDLILGRVEKLTHGLQWVGCEPTIPPPTGDLLSLSYNKCILPDGRKRIVAKVQLFPFFSTPVYHIVVGEWDGDLKDAAGDAVS